jgi:hypothetical protein
MRNDRVETLCVGNESSHNFSIDSVVSFWSLRCCQELVDAGNVEGKLLIKFLVTSVKKKEDQVETREQRCRQVDVFMRFQVGVISSVERVCCCEH